MTQRVIVITGTSSSEAVAAEIEAAIASSDVSDIVLDIQGPVELMHDGAMRDLAELIVGRKSRAASESGSRELDYLRHDPSKRWGRRW